MLATNRRQNRGARTRICEAIRAGLAVCMAVSLSVSPARAMAQAKPSQISAQVDAALTDAVPEPNGPGAVVLITRGDDPVFAGSRGMADLSWNVPLAPSQTFAIASITKTFTAAAIVRLSEQHRLSLDDTLSEYLPTFPAGEGITIRQLLSHTAGVSDKAILSDAPSGFLRQDITLADLVSQIATQPSDFTPGSRQKYSNAGYILLGAIIEKVTGASWQDALRDLVIAPAGLQATDYAPASTIIPGRVSGYTNDTADRALANADYISLSVPSSAGGLVSTAEDMNRWMRALNQGDVVSTGDF